MQPYTKKLLPVVLFAILGLGVSLWIGVLHGRLSADPSYTSFCNVSDQVNCDRVLASRYAELGGISISSWAVIYYLLVFGAAAGVAKANRATMRENLGTALWVLGGFGFAFSAYMAFIAFAILNTICLMCSALYVVSICLLVATWRLHNSLRTLGRRQPAAPDRSIVIAGAVAGLGLVLVIVYELLAPSARAATSDEIRRLRPEFYKWFFAQPVVPNMAAAGASTGAANAPVTLVEFSDFQCGHCAKLHEVLEEVLASERGRVRIVFRHFPLDSSCNPALKRGVHAEACLAAVAAECAHEQGRFWEYHRLLFKNQSRLSRDFLLRYASDLGLDKDRFVTCLASDAAMQRVRQDVADGQRAEIDSTPTIFVNDRRIKGALETDRLLDAFVLATNPVAPK